MFITLFINNLITAWLFVLNWRVFEGDRQTFTLKVCWRSYNVLPPELSCSTHPKTLPARKEEGEKEKGEEGGEEEKHRVLKEKNALILT